MNKKIDITFVSDTANSDAIYQLASGYISTTTILFEKENIDARLILQVHDELILEAHKDHAERAYEILKDSMEKSIELSVPLDVEAHIGENWLEAK